MIKDAIKLFLVSCLVVGCVVAWLGIGSGLIDINRLMGAPSVPDKPRIVSAGPDTTTGFGYYDRKKERGR